MKQMVIKNKETGQELARINIPKANRKSIIFAPDFIGYSYCLLIRDCNTDKVLYTIKIKPEWNCILKFCVENSK